MGADGDGVLTAPKSRLHLCVMTACRVLERGLWSSKKLIFTFHYAVLYSTQEVAVAPKARVMVPAPAIRLRICQICVDKSNDGS